jgi:hypothetical protein
MQLLAGLGAEQFIEQLLFPGANAEADRDAAQADCQMHGELAGAGQLPAGGDHRARRGQQSGRHQAEPRDGLEHHHHRERAEPVHEPGRRRSPPRAH